MIHDVFNKYLFLVKVLVEAEPFPFGKDQPPNMVSVSLSDPNKNEPELFQVVNKGQGFLTLYHYPENNHKSMREWKIRKEHAEQTAVVLRDFGKIKEMDLIFGEYNIIHY